MHRRGNRQAGLHTAAWFFALVLLSSQLLAWVHLSSHGHPALGTSSATIVSPSHALDAKPGTQSSFIEHCSLCQVAGQLAQGVASAWHHVTLLTPRESLLSLGLQAPSRELTATDPARAPPLIP